MRTSLPEGFKKCMISYASKSRHHEGPTAGADVAAGADAADAAGLEAYEHTPPDALLRLMLLLVLMLMLMLVLMLLLMMLVLGLKLMFERLLPAVAGSASTATAAAAAAAASAAAAAACCLLLAAACCCLLLLAACCCCLLVGFVLLVPRPISGS